jgi:hypothetical protein
MNASKRMGLRKSIEGLRDGIDRWSIEGLRDALD